MAVWMKIVDDIVESIRNGEYAVDGQLASENKLTKIYSSTRHDVRKAYERLTEMGYVYSKQGKGHYYKSKHDRIELLLEGDTSFTEKMGKNRHKLETINIDFTELKNDSRIRKKLHISMEDRIFKISRLRIINDEEVALHTSYVSNKLFKEIEKDGPTITSMFRYYKEHGYSSFYYKQSDLQTLLPSRYEREVLKCPSLVPILLLESQCMDKATNEILEITKIVYRGDRFVYRLQPKW